MTLTEAEITQGSRIFVHFDYIENEADGPGEAREQLSQPASAQKEKFVREEPNDFESENFQEDIPGFQHPVPVFEFPTEPKPGYTIEPSYDDLYTMTEEELRNVENFQIMNEHGSICFLEPVDLVGVDLRNIVVIDEKGAEVYPDGDDLLQ